ncbi:hypothetical protein AB0D04_00965 [Streptomyces sp. NPDC048483]|uniref:hypothetical protein n=1 Tax=Streptomyces sp. NPDC048483 TaxID=3154927 RepID=UPI0034144D0C
MQAGSVVGACGLMLLGAGTARAQDPSLLEAAVGVDLADVTGMVSNTMCNNRLADFNYKSPRIKSPHPCINGPSHSGNSLHSGNFINRGNPNNSGNLSSTNGSTNSANSASGNQAGSENNIQRLLGGLRH